MYSEKEMQISNKSYINKSFDTIYPELVQLIQSLTDRWDPTSTNESDPLIVLTKLLAFIGDKTSYNSDKGALEVLLPSATQESSFRTIAETNGYNMKYYQSATTNISVKYTGGLENNRSIIFVPFESQFTDKANSITYTLIPNKNIGDISLTKDNNVGSGLIIQGTYADIIVNNSNIIQLANLDGNNRVYFPNTMVAENGIFVCSNGSSDWVNWKKVYNLNTYVPHSYIFKFGFDSDKNLPYIQFPDDIVDIIGSGVIVRYIITTGANGNVPKGYINTIGKSTLNGLKFYINEEISDEDVPSEDDNGYSYFVVENIAAATNGVDKENIDEAYFNYQRIVGTFDTLVTPRDFTNYIYNYVDDNLNPVVSNAQITDRRIDTNYVIPVVSWTALGSTMTYKVKQDGGVDLMTPFDLALYPLQYVSTIYDDTTYANTFGIANNIELLPNFFQDSQSIDHTYLNPTDLGANCNYAYKNKYKLNAKLTTTKKVNDTERALIVNSVKQALYQKFNARKVNYGTELPYDELLETIQNADVRIKNVSLDEPDVETYVLLGNGNEVQYLGTSATSPYVDAVAKNVLAGKVSLWEYDNDFKYKWSQSINSKINNVNTISTSLTLAATGVNATTLGKNQVVQLMSTNYNTTNTAVVGVNYVFNANNNLPKNTAYKLVGDDYLILNTTNSNDDEMTYKYTATQVKTWLNGTLSKTETVNENVIRSDFNLVVGQSSSSSAPVVTVEGNDYRMYTLDTDQNIEFLQPVSITLNSERNNSLYKMYWLRNNATNNLFPDAEHDGVKDTILAEGEFVIYTNNNMDQIEVFGAGTKLTTNLVNNDWTISVDYTISLDTINSSDIATYGALQWKTIYFALGNYLSVEQLNILTLTENDSYIYDYQINKTLTSLQDDFIYTIAGNDPKTISASDYVGWKIRTRLDLNCGPELPQQINTGEVITVDGTPISSNYILLSQLIQKSGDSDLIWNNITPLNLLYYTYVPIQLTKADSTVVDLPDGTIELNLDSLGTTSATFYLTIPELTNTVTGTTVYFNVNAGIDCTMSFSDTPGTITDLNTGTEYDEDNVPIDIDSNYIYSLKCRNINGSVFISLDGNGNNLQGSIYISAPKIVNEVNTIFGFDNDATSDTIILTKIDDLARVGDGKNNFNYFYDVPNAKAIDVEDFTLASTLWNVNNILNKSTIAQIDFENSIIDVIKSSRL